jgi:Family of unknown function (DUF6328)
MTTAAREPERREERSEEERERLNRQMMELLNELRVAMPGVQIAALALAMNGAVLLVTDVLFEAGTVAVTVVLIASLYLSLWFGFGLVRRAQK